MSAGKDGGAAGWQVGQRAVVNRRDVVTILRVTPSGRAVVEWRGGESTFDANGAERTNGYRRARLAPLTKEIEDEIAHAARSLLVFGDLGKVVDDLRAWMRDARPGWGRDTAELDDVETAERLLAAISAARGVKP